MKPLALVLALAFFVIGLLYGLGILNFFTKSGAEHSHHFTHLVACWIIALLCLVWFRFQGSPSR